MKYTDNSPVIWVVKLKDGEVIKIDMLYKEYLKIVGFLSQKMDVFVAGSFIPFDNINYTTMKKGSF